MEDLTQGIINSKATEIYTKFLVNFQNLSFYTDEHREECEILAKHNAIYFIHCQIIPTIGSEADIDYWNSVMIALRDTKY